MSYNLVSYLFYLPITFYITIVIGRDLNQKGYWYLLEAFHQEEQLVQTINRFLLIGYYLLNLGYAAVSIQFFTEISSWQNMFEELMFRIGALIIGLGLIHYFNLLIFNRFTTHIQQLFSNHSPLK